MTAAFASASGLVLGYGNQVALEASSFTIPHQAVTAIIGPNGSGKSTLLNALAGIIKPMAGDLTVLGGAPGRRGTTAYVMQSPNFPVGTPITVREAIGMGLYPTLGWFKRPNAKDHERVAAAMARVDVAGLAKRHLDELSGGQRQRVYVAQGLTQQHETLLLDEPLTGLDLVSMRTIDQIIHSEREDGHGVVLTTHDLDEARAADWVLLTSGRVLAFGPPNQVLTRANLEAAYGLGSLHEAGDAFFDDHASGGGVTIPRTDGRQSPGS